MTFNIEKLSRRAALSIVGLFALVAGLAGIGLPPLDRDEARFAQATAQMLETGDFITIRFQKEERNKKPAGIHWLQSASVAAFSHAEAREIWAYRLPSLLAAIIAALGTYLIGERFFDRSTGLIAAVALSATPVFITEATIAKTDAALLASVVVAQFALTCLFTEARANRPIRWIMSLIFWLAISGSILIKGPVAPLIVGLTVTVLILTHRTLPWRRMLKPLVGLAIIVLTVAPWALAIGHATEGRFFTDALGGDMFGKVGAAQESHGGPPGYHIAFGVILLWPVIAVLPAALMSAWKQRKSSDIIFLFAWAAPAWVIFELTATKLPHYTLPLYPAIALVAARFAVVAGKASGVSALYKRMNQISALVYGMISIAIAVGIAALPVALNAGPIATLTSFSAGLIGLCAIAIAIGFWRGKIVRSMIAASVLGATTMWALGGAVLPNVEALKVSSRLASMIEKEKLSELKNGAPPAILSGYYEPSAVFLLGSDTRLLGGAEAAKQAALHSTGAIAVETREKEAFLAALVESGVRLDEIGSVDGLNYSNGRDVELTVYRLSPENLDE